MGGLRDLKYLNLSRFRVSGQVPIELSTLSKLISLDLSLNIEPSSGAQLLQIQNPSLPTLVKNLTTLEILRLTQVNISSPVPQTLTNLISLKILRLQNCNLNGSFPEDIFQLPQPQILNLASNNTNLPHPCTFLHPHNPHSLFPRALSTLPHTQIPLLHIESATTEKSQQRQNQTTRARISLNQSQIWLLLRDLKL
ncbi:hypothetical protein Droror1_Dr00021329 [Drosera rotundifolia]